MGQGRGRRVTLADRNEAIKQIDEAVKDGSSIESACKAIGIDKRTYERWRKKPYGDLRRGPVSEPANKLSEEERQRILDTANSPRFCDKSPQQIVPLLADEGIYIASESSFYRTLKAAGLNAHRGRSKPPTRKKPDELVARGPNQVYSWDITFLRSTVSGMFFYLYLFMDVYSRKIVGFEVHEEQSSDLSADMLRKICISEGVGPNRVVLHADNGGPMKGATMLATMQRLGVVPSFSRPSVSDDNPFSEALFKTLKYCPQFPSRPFESPEEAREWVRNFVRWYNEEHMHSGINFVTPASRHAGVDKKILEKRHEIYQQAKKSRPERWSGKTRNWRHMSEVFLNCLKGKTNADTKSAA